MPTLLLLAQQSSGAGQSVLFAGGAVVTIVIGIFILASIFWIWMLIDCLVSSLPPLEKLVWLVIIFFLHLIGAIIYFIVGRPKARAG
jgi:phospholipase D-like protein